MANDGLVGESLINMGGAGPSRPVNTFSIWRYLLLIIVIGTAALYALPNLFQPDDALQIRPVDSEAVADQALLERSVAALKAANIDLVGAELADDNALIRVANSDVQVAAQRVLRGELNPTEIGQNGEESGEDLYTIALNQAATTPQWLRDLGGKPMSYGLDLSGGVHFLLQVDMEGFLSRRAGITAATIERLLRDNNLRGATSRRRFEWATGTTISIPFRTEANRDAALPFLRDVNNVTGYDIDTRTVNGQPGVRLELQAQEKRTLEDYAISQNLQSLRNRVNELGVSEPLVQRLGRSRIVLDLPGVRDSAEAKKIINKFANLEFRLVAAPDASRADTEEFEYEGSTVRLLRENIVTGDQVTNAQQDYDPESGLPQVSISLDAEGGKRMNNATKDNIGNPMSVLFLESKTRERKQIIDGEEVVKLVTTETKRVINVATIQAALGFNFRITGIGLGEARELALLLRAGALAAPMYIVEERTVGPQLGEENIKRGFTSLYIGLGLVAVFMMIYYKLFGVAAVVALAANLILIVAIMSVLGATLTLPGIAGIVLTIGMAVDANVLIFSRIREELRDRAPQAAIQAGFDRAFVTILDANITTFFVAIILFSVGSGPVKGFAITLAVGIVTSMFTAILGTRGIVNLIFGGRKLTRIAI